MSIFAKILGFHVINFIIIKVADGFSQRAGLRTRVAKKPATFSVLLSSKRGLIVFSIHVWLPVHIFHVLHAKHRSKHHLSWYAVREEQRDLSLLPPCPKDARLHGLGLNTHKLGLKDPPWIAGEVVRKHFHILTSGSGTHKFSKNLLSSVLPFYLRKTEPRAGKKRQRHGWCADAAVDLVEPNYFH